MQIEILGGIGIGLVWGWCLGFWNAGEGRDRHWRNALASALSVLPLGAIHQAYTGRRALLSFIVAVALAFIIHLAWRVHLRRRVAV